jgi:hypothetical protein
MTALCSAAQPVHSVRSHYGDSQRLTMVIERVRPASAGSSSESCHLSWVWFVTAMRDGDGGRQRWTNTTCWRSVSSHTALACGRLPTDTDLTRQREVVDAFLAASRGGDFDALLAVLDPDVVLRADTSGVAPGASKVVRGAAAVTAQALTFSRLFAQPALVNGAAGLVTAPEGRPLAVMGFTITRGKIVENNILADPARLSQLDVAELSDQQRSPLAALHRRA